MTGSGHEDRRSPIPPTWPLPRNFANSSSGPVPPANPHDELVRDLADYDRAFGLTDDEEEVA